MFTHSDFRLVIHSVNKRDTMQIGVHKEDLMICRMMNDGVPALPCPFALRGMIVMPRFQAHLYSISLTRIKSSSP